MTHLQQAKSELETYVSAVAQHPEEYNAAKLRYLEERIVAAATDLNLKCPF